ncbi:MAG: lipoprotein [Xanthomonadales bacterium]|nr:lipoprotein [Xanthomonadales bacterium]
MIFKAARILCFALALAMLAGCGQKGDLYLPDSDPPAESQEDEEEA